MAYRPPLHPTANNPATRIPHNNTIFPTSANPKQNQNSSSGTTPATSQADNNAGTAKSTNNLSFYHCAPPSKLTHYYSLLFLRRRLYTTLFFLPPTLTLILYHTPSILASALLKLQGITGNHLCLTLSTTAVLCHSFYTYGLGKYAPSQTEYDDALKKCFWRLELLVLILVTLLVRGLFLGDVPTTSWLQDAESLSWVLSTLQRGVVVDSNNDAATGYLWLSSSILLVARCLVLSWMVRLRFVGPISIARCSAFPLPTNLLTRTIQSIKLSLTSPNLVMDHLLRPEEDNQTTQQQQQQQQQPQSTFKPSKKCTQFEKPTIPIILWQLVSHSICGFLYYKLTIPTQFMSSTTIAVSLDHPQTWIPMASCIILSVLTLFSTYLIHGSNNDREPPHELSIQTRRKRHTNSLAPQSAKTNGGSSSSRDDEKLTSSTSNAKDGPQEGNANDYNDNATEEEWDSSILLNTVQEEVIKKLYQSKLILAWIIIPILMMLFNQHVLVSTKFITSSTSQDWVQYLIFGTYPQTLFLVSYILIVDILVRSVLMVKGVNVDRLLSSIPSNSENSKSSNNRERSARGSVNRSSSSNTNLSDTEEAFTAEDFMIESILAGLGNRFVEDVINPDADFLNAKNKQYSSGINDGGIGTRNTRVRGFIDLEEEETRRNDFMINNVAKAIEEGLISGCTVFEHDLMRVVLLESLGGGGGGHSTSRCEKNTLSPLALSVQQKLQPKRGNMDISSEQLHLGLTSRHQFSLMRRLQVIMQDHRSQQQQPPVVPLVRAMCAYAGGVGEALMRMSMNIPSIGETTWSFPPSSSSSIEYAILGAARLVVLNFLDPSTNIFQKRSNRLSLLVPVVLQTIYIVRSGILDYAQYLIDINDVRIGNVRAQTNPRQTHRPQQTRNIRNDVDIAEKIGKFIAMKCPDLSSVLNTCDEAAIIIMETLLKVDGQRDIDVKVGDECKMWLNGLHSHQYFQVKQFMR